MPKGQKHYKITVLLLKEDIGEPEDALKDPDKLVKHDLAGDAPYEGAFFLAKSVTRTPTWQAFVQPALSKKLQNVFNAGASGVLILKAKKRLFAVTFGYGRNLLKPDCFVQGFGLRTALNRVDPSRLRSMDLKTYQELVLSTRRQVSRGSELGTFGLDVARDLLRAVVGEPTDGAFAKRLAGADALTLTVPITAKGLGKKCETLLEAYQDNKYKTHFDWIDHLEEVRDAAVVSTLDGKLLDALKNGNTDNLCLVPAEPIDWEDVDVFKITDTGRHTEFADLDIDDYLAALGDDKQNDLTVDKLKHHRVRVRYSGGDHLVDKWTVYGCLVWETEEQNQLYAFVDGRWFRIDKTFATRVRKYVKEIPAPQNPLPDAQDGEHEEDYNKRVAGMRKDLALLDQKFVKPTDATTQIEMCDLFSTSRQFFHVKRKTRSATLSHLFSQGSVAAQVFLQDEKVRTDLAAILTKDKKNAFVPLVPNDRPTASQYEVAYAIIAKPRKGRPAALPFFSQLNLMQQAKFLRGLGFNVTLQRVSES